MALPAAEERPGGRLHALPKAELHVHLDGSLRAETLVELAQERNVGLPTHDATALRTYMVAADAGSLTAYLDRFRLSLAVMQDAEALERIAYELVEDHAAENVRYVEVRFCPALNTEGGLTAPEVLDAVLAGLARAERALPVRTAVIVCGLRSLPAAVSMEMAELAIAYADRGVHAFDLAGAEAGHPVREHLEAVRMVAAAGLPVTIHAGEAYGPDSIRQAVELGGASRIGHGTRLVEDPELLARVREAGIALEVCLTSNVQTGVTASYAEHPLRRFVDEGLVTCLCTDNRLISGVTLTEEYEHAHAALGFAWSELVRLARNGFERAYAAAPMRAQMLAAFDDEAGRLAEGS
jgi:adenosine deaminase